jgi:hypothetical protein
MVRTITILEDFDYYESFIIIYLWWESWEIFVSKHLVDRVEDTKIKGRNNNGTCIVSSTNIENGFISVKFYV